ncbi:MAG: sulfatase [Sedimentisphaerales bacterium]|nr:sulfatase [Sedimentisphaerales bacterium]
MRTVQMHRRQFLKTIGAGVMGLTLPGRLCAAGYSRYRPNILFIMADDHSANAISCYGSRLYHVAKTPNIDRIAAEGACLLNCFCTNSICVPSRAAILTGQYSHINGVYTLADQLDPEHPNLAKYLKSAGYQTAVVGKWHLKTEPTGFDYWNILPGQGRYHNPVMKTSDKNQKPPKPSIMEEIAEKAMEWLSIPADFEAQTDGPKQQSPENEKKPDGTITYRGFSTDVITDLSLEWLKKRDGSKPFFLMTHFKNPHAPWHFAQRHADLYKDVEIPEPESLWENLSHRSEGSREYGFTVSETLLERMQKPDYPTGPLNTDGMNQQQKTKAAYQKYLKDYLRCVAAVDENVGRLLDFIKQQRIERETIVIYTSDQGLFLGEHNYIDKRWMFEESMRMPLLVRYPTGIKAGTVNDDIIINTDFVPTLLDYAGVDIPADVQGRSFRDNLAGRTPSDWRTSMYYRYWQHGARPAHYGLRTKRYKLIFFYGLPLDVKGAEAKPTKAGWELYDLLRDPFELNNLYGHPAYTKKVQQLKGELLEKKKQLGDTDEKYPELLELVKQSR